MRTWMVMAFAALAGCGDDVDCCKIPLDAPIELPTHTNGYVFDKISLPWSNLTAREYGIDLNGDALVDNQLGMVVSTLAGMGLESQADMDQLIERGDVITLGILSADDLTNETTATFEIYRGGDPVPAPCASPQDTTCRQHFAGNGRFSGVYYWVAPLFGSIVSGRLHAGGGQLAVQLSIAGSAPFTVTLVGARTDLMGTATTLTGKLGGGVTKTDFETQILPAMRDGFATQVARDCTMPASPPACGCAQDSRGKTLLGLFDVSPIDCSISIT